jgi:hypothetical protein
VIRDLAPSQKAKKMMDSSSRPEELVGTQPEDPGETSGSPKNRRSGRVTKEVPILIIGTDAEGRVFTEETHTVVLSQHGAGIVSRQRLTAEQEFILRAVELNREVEVRVVGEIASQGEMHTYGVAFLSQRGNFWNMEFPPPKQWAERPVVLTLECTGCRAMVALTDGDFEYDICAIHGGLARFCDECGLLTVWRQSQEAMPAVSRPAGHRHKAKSLKEPVAAHLVEEVEIDERPAEIIPLADAMEGTERRARVRAKVNFYACVRTEKFGDEIVSCIDMSRGGLSFRSRTEYQKAMGLEIAVPFSPEASKGAPAIFVRGRIANVKEMANGEMWRCGVEFLRG